MARGSRVCPHCGRLNGIDESRCYSCGRRLPGPLASSVQAWLGDFSADGLPGTKVMAALCIGVYGLCMLSEAGGGLSGLFSGFLPWTLLRFGALFGPVLPDEPWRLLSAVFVHGSLIHIGLNMLGLMNLGRALEPHFRTARFLILYVLSGILGYVATVWWRGSWAFSVGASGSLLGLLGAYIAALLVRRNPGWHRVFVSNLILILALTFFAGGSGLGRIDHAAHIGGFVAGFGIGFLFELERRPRQRDLVAAAVSALLVLASVASIVLSVRSPVWKAFKQVQEAARLGADSE